jgi:L-ascorbate metabolism protein UlaG (beta-lactamase superfamily)
MRTPRAPEGVERYRRWYLEEGDRTLAEGAIRITSFGTTTLLFDDGTTRLMIDGFFTRPSLAEGLEVPVRTDTLAVKAALARAGVDRLDALLVAHSHFDHAMDAADVARRTGALLIGSMSTLNVGRGGDLPEGQMARIEPGRVWSFGRFTVTALRSRHGLVAGAPVDTGATIDAPLRQPARVLDYREGGVYDFLIGWGGKRILVKPSAEFLPGALQDVRADILLLGISGLGMRDSTFRNAYYDATVGTVHPEMVIPIHWDDFFRPLEDRLVAAGDGRDLAVSFDFLRRRLAADHIAFGILQGYGSVALFGKGMVGSVPRP